MPSLVAEVNNAHRICDPHYLAHYRRHRRRAAGLLQRTKATTIIVTILAGPLNYVGVNPKVDCKVPEPSK